MNTPPLFERKKATQAQIDALHRLAQAATAHTGTRAGRAQVKRDVLLLADALGIEIAEV